MRPLTILSPLLHARCGFVAELVDPRPEVVGQLGVLNRTELPIVYIAADGERLEIPQAQPGV